MPSETFLPNNNSQQTEKCHHYTYLKEFRTQQCPLFLQHKCTQHRPFTCFHWHFMNQRRRRPVRRRDGTFNYSPDIYCTKFDETTGICPDKDDCPYLHRTAGDTERRYHLRYYKTGTCVHETDTKGNCVKNGPHCAFAHGAEDLRSPVYDVRELQAMDIPGLPGDKSPVSSVSSPPGSLEKDRTLTDDPTWNDTNYVLSNYKTEPCKRPPRLCRQGYACPQYHNNRDRRRSPKLLKYRSPPCPNVKHGDDWGDPSQCEKEDSCGYCHTRTEQQFHPEIYKSTKCNDMVQTGYCPRGPFCAFAHVEQEMMIHRDVNISSDNLLSAFIDCVSPGTSTNGTTKPHTPPTFTLPPPEIPIPGMITKLNGTTIADIVRSGSRISESKENISPPINHIPQPIGKERLNSYSNKNYSNILASETFDNNNYGSMVEPIGKERSISVSSNTSIEMSPLTAMFYPPPPGPPPSLHLRDDPQHHLQHLQHQLLSIDVDLTLDSDEKLKRKQNLILLHNLSSSRVNQHFSTSPGIPSSMSSMSPLATSFYPPADTVESVIGNALDDLTFDDFDITSIDREIMDHDDTNSISSSVSVGLSSSGCFGGVSVPVSIPHTNMMTHNSLSQSPSSPLVVQIAPLQLQQQKQEHQIEQAAAAFHSHPNPGKYPAPAFSDVSLSSLSPRSVEQSPMYSPSVTNTNHNNSHVSDVGRLHDEITLYKNKLLSWEDGYSQAKNACEAWRKEAEESNRKATISEEDRKHAIKQRDEAVGQMKKMKEQDAGGHSGYLRCLQPVKDLETLPATQLCQLQHVLRLDLERLDKIMQRSAAKCVRCLERPKSVMLTPCSHYVLCDMCALLCIECPVCHIVITKKTSLITPI